MKKPVYLVATLVFTLFIHFLKAQTPGLIVRPAGGNGITALNPDGNGYTTSSGGKFITNDITESEIPFKVVPPALIEPIGDIRTGGTGSFTDIVPGPDASGFYMYKDATNIYFRLRIGNIVNGAKGYSILIDTDGKMGATGSAPDPNYVAPTTGSFGNPGFEYEVALLTNFNVSVFSIDGTASPVVPVTYSLATNSQISVALSLDNNNADYFFDFFVPLSAIGNPANVRVAATTLTSPNSVFQAQRSDIYGIDDAQFANAASAWETVVKTQPSINLTSFSGVGVNCTAAPVVNTGVVAGSSVSVTGTWTKSSSYAGNSATITLYKNGVSSGTTTVTSGATWSIAAGTLVNGDQIYAKAQAAGESACEVSSTVTVTNCLSLPTSPVLTCASLKGISGTMPSTGSGNTVQVYQLALSTASPFSTQVSTVSNLTYPTTTSFAYYTNGCSGGSNNVATGEYMIVTYSGTCYSEPAFVCVNSGSSGTPAAISTNTISITSALYPSASSIAGTGATSGGILRLFINGKYITSINASATTFSFTGLTLQSGDQIRIYQQVSGGCITQSALFTVSCYTAPPLINVNATGNLLSGVTTITGSSAYPGASVQVYKGTAPGGTSTGSAVTVASNGAWTATIPAMSNGETYYAVQTYNSCTSAASSAVTVLTPSSCPSITGTYTDKSTSVNGTMPSLFTGTIRLYEDGGLIGSVSITNNTSWSIAVPANTLYYQGILTSTAQATGTAESAGCGTSVVSCTSPLAPGVSPLTSTIKVNQQVTYSLSNVNANAWYSLVDNTGASYTTSSYRTTTAGFSLTSDVFISQGNYSLFLVADELNGCPPTTVAASVSVNITLPLRLLYFNGRYINSQSQFTWETTDEINVSHFELEQSINGSSFTQVAIIPVQSSNSTIQKYSYNKDGALQQAVYFRLKIVDIDGRSQYSGVIVLKPGESITSKLTAMPNHFTDKAWLKYSSEKTGNIEVMIYSADGRILSKFRQPVTKGDNIFEVNATQKLAAGVYYVQVLGVENTNRHSATIIKESH